MFALVNDVEAYPRRFDWCHDAEILESGPHGMLVRLDLGLGKFRTGFTTRNTLSPPHHIDMELVEGPLRKLEGRWQFHALDEGACKVSVSLEFEPKSALLGPALALGFQALAEHMVNDFVRVADEDGADMAADVPARREAGA